MLIFERHGSIKSFPKLKQPVIKIRFPESAQN